MKTDAYLITCLTNLHVGSGESNYGVVDNLVQRDSISEIPIIHSSSLKGALREHYKDEWGENSDELNYVFGPDDSRNSSSKKDEVKSGIGHYKFFEANMIVLPVRSNVKQFFRATSSFLLEECNNKAKALDIKNFNINPFAEENTTKSNPNIIEENNNCVLEDWSAVGNLTLVEGVNHIGENPALFHTDSFKELAKHLPVIARNQLDNGESKNLWYEEVVPRESRFIFFVSKPKENNEVKYGSDFDKKIENKVVQIGGNASIGYGFCKIKKISE